MPPLTASSSLPTHQWDYTRIKLEEPPERLAALQRLQAATGSGSLTGRLDLERQVRPLLAQWTS